MPPTSTRARQPGSTTVVETASRISAGPATLCPAGSPSRSYTGVERAAPPIHVSTIARGGAAASGSDTIAPPGAGVSAIASATIVSITSAPLPT